MYLWYIKTVASFQRGSSGDDLTGLHQSYVRGGGGGGKGWGVGGEWRVEVVSALYHYSNDNVAETGCLSAGKLGDPLRVFLMAIL